MTDEEIQKEEEAIDKEIARQIAEPVDMNLVDMVIAYDDLRKILKRMASLERYKLKQATKEYYLNKKMCTKS